MNSIEEKLWNYIDGNCAPDEEHAIARLIATDENYRLKYDELLALNQEFAAMELDEPPMAFTYNVMEAIRTEHAAQPLKATVNKKVILGITAFFVLVVCVLLAYTLININWTAAGSPLINASKVNMPQAGNLLSKPVIMGFLFFDVVLGLFLFDAFLHKKKRQHSI